MLVKRGIGTVFGVHRGSVIGLLLLGRLLAGWVLAVLLGVSAVVLGLGQLLLDLRSAATLCGIAGALRKGWQGDGGR